MGDRYNEDQEHFVDILRVAQNAHDAFERLGLRTARALPLVQTCIRERKANVERERAQRGDIGIVEATRTIEREHERILDASVDDERHRNGATSPGPVDLRVGDVVAPDGQATEHLTQVGIERHRGLVRSRNTALDGRRDDGRVLAVIHPFVDETTIGGKCGSHTLNDTEEHVTPIQRFVQTLVDHREQLTVARLPPCCSKRAFRIENPCYRSAVHRERFAFRLGRFAVERNRNHPERTAAGHQRSEKQIAFADRRAYADEGALRVARNKRDATIAKARERVQKEPAQLGGAVAQRKPNRAGRFDRSGDAFIVEKQYRSDSLRNAGKRTGRNRRRFCLWRGCISQAYQRREAIDLGLNGVLLSGLGC